MTTIPENKIPVAVLLPKLSRADQSAFVALCDEFETAKKEVSSYGNDARVARKRELREAIKTARGDTALSLGVELANNDEVFTHARRGAKQRVKALGPKFMELFPRLFALCESHCDETAKTVRDSWREHVAPFGGETIHGASPVLTSLQAWRANLAEKRRHLEAVTTAGATPPHPRDILPFNT